MHCVAERSRLADQVALADLAAAHAARRADLGLPAGGGARRARGRPGRPRAARAAAGRRRPLLPRTRPARAAAGGRRHAGAAPGGAAVGRRRRGAGGAGLAPRDGVQGGRAAGAGAVVRAAGRRGRRGGGGVHAAGTRGRRCLEPGGHAGPLGAAGHSGAGCGLWACRQLRVPARACRAVSVVLCARDAPGWTELQPLWLQ